MPPLVHLIDADVPAEALEQLSALRRPAQPIVSIGPAPTLRVAQSPPAEKSQKCDAPARGVPRKGDIHCLHRPLGLAPLARARLRRLLPRGTVVHAWSVDLLPLAASAAGDVGGRAILSLSHLPARSETGKLPWIIGQYRCLATVPTRKDREQLLAAGADPARVAVLPPAGSVGDARDRRDVTRTQLSLTDDDLAVVVPQQMLRGAGHHWASWVHAIVRHVRRDVRLVFAGAGPHERAVRDFAETTGFGGEVRYPAGQLPLADVLAACDIAAFLCGRDLGLNRLLAALDAAVPVLASRTPDQADLLDHEHTALLVNPGDPRAASAGLMRLAEDPDLRQRLARAGRNLAREFTPARARQRMDELLAIGPI
jgi:glycosyltransferase involved in cell wall biosynthesis